MSPIQIKQLLELPKEEKINIIQMLWDNIAEEQSNVATPEWHKQILDERLKKVGNGTATFTSWEEIKKKFSR